MEKFLAPFAPYAYAIMPSCLASCSSLIPDKSSLAGLAGEPLSRKKHSARQSRNQTCNISAKVQRRKGKEKFPNLAAWRASQSSTPGAPPHRASPPA
jgi:hypothetical protein